jgi:HEAT repeat protein
MADPQPKSPESSEFLLGRLFIVPLIIVVVIVLCAVVVVLSFGAIASSSEEPIDRVLAKLEASSGGRVADVALMPRDKELWQAAQELAARLSQPEELDPESVPQVQARLTALVARDLNIVSADNDTHRQILFFTMMAAAKAGATDVIPLLVQATKSELADLRQQAVVALAAFVHLHDLPLVRQRAVDLLPLLDDSSEEVRIVTSAALGSLADAENEAVVGALGRVCATLQQPRDVRWNAALALARIGAENPTAMLLVDDMLQRSFWEGQRIQYTARDGVSVDRPMTSKEVRDRLLAVLDAVEELDQDDVRQRIAVLAQDKELAVAGQARTQLKSRSAATPDDG